MSETQDEQAFENERSRQALAQLLQARGEQQAAAIVGVSTFREEWADNWNGGQYEVILAVPAELYDQALSEFRDAIDVACADVVGHAHYRGLDICVRRSPYDPEWVRKVVEAGDRRWVPSERVNVAALDHAEA